MDLIEFQDLPNTDTPINSENLNYNFKKLNKANTYSEEEQVIGDWINNKPIYRKVIEVSQYSNGFKEIAVNIANVETIISLRGMAQKGNEAFAIPSAYNSSYFDPVVAVINGTTLTSLRLNSTSDRTSYYGFLIVEYTKTTD